MVSPIAFIEKGTALHSQMICQKLHGDHSRVWVVITLTWKNKIFEIRFISRDVKSMFDQIPNKTNYEGCYKYTSSFFFISKISKLMVWEVNLSIKKLSQNWIPVLRGFGICVET